MATAAAAQQPSPGVTWLPLGNSMPDGPVEQAVTMNDALYVIYIQSNAPGGNYTMARWDGSSWMEVTRFHIEGSGLNALAAYNGDLYIGGAFTSVNGVQRTAGIARWDGAAWGSVGGGVAVSPNHAEITAMEEFNGELYCTGTLDTVGGVTVRGIARWNGSRWASLGKGFGPEYITYYTGTSLTILDGLLYVGGDFGEADDLPVGQIARWDGNAWSGIKWSIPNRHEWIDARSILLTSFRGELYMHAYYFTDYGVVGYGSHIDKLTDSGWSRIAFSSPVYRFQVFDDMLYASNNMLNTNPNNRTLFRRWNGKESEQIDSFPGFAVFTLTVYRGALIVGGNFQNYGSNHVSYLAMMCENQNCSGTTEAPIDANRTASDDAPTPYPNPTTGELLLRGTIRPGALLRVNDMLGRTVMSAVATGGAEMRLDLSSLPSGIYFLSVPGAHGAVTRQVTLVR